MVTINVDEKIKKRFDEFLAILSGIKKRLLFASDGMNYLLNLFDEDVKRRMET